ncbi:hypothetical protein [Limibacterium fermenti]|uniref:hypothetical protein n=1 Tax=Limibacterium fermenti TaxID=3229863 RepID=UPI000E9D62F2|nr:hypothetical protein [Porphyromonadaceae bacterium]
MLAPILEETANELRGCGVFAQDYINAYLNITTLYQVQDVQILLYFRNGVPSGRRIGAISKEQLLKDISFRLTS